MAPKRKAPATADKAVPLSKKRLTRISAAVAAVANPQSDSDTSTPSPPKTDTKAKSKANISPGKAPAIKGKAKAKDIVVKSSEDEMEDDNGDVVIEEQLKKKKALVKASEKEKKPPAKPKARKVSIAAHSPRGSTTTPAEPAPGKTKAKAKPAKPTKSVPFEEALREWFTPFAEEGEPGKMGADGIERLFEEMQISMDGVHAFILAWQVNSKPGTFGTFELADFERRLRPYEIASVDQLKKHLMAVEKTLYGPHSSDAEFRSFHSFLFPYLKAQGLRSLPPEMAIAALSVSIVPKYPLGEQFVEFATALGDAFKSVSSDVWTQLLAFCQTVQPDLTNWSEDDAWPSTIDAFVEWKKAKDQAVSAA
ncbi:hypothetical protein JCM1841_004352 [Sporobolomyces salmonicolor]